MAKASTGSGKPGWVWVFIPTAAIALIGFFLYLNTVPSSADLETVRRDAGKVLQQGIEKAREEAAKQADKPTYDFYRLLEEQKVEALKVDKYVSTPKVDLNDPIERAAREQAAQASGRTPETRVAIANTAPASSAPATSGSAASAPVASAPVVTAPVARPAPAAPASAAETYLLQVGSFRTSSDAETMRANLMLIGMDARQESAVVNGSTWYRVYVGPFKDRSSASKAQSTLASNSINSLLITK